MRIKQSRQGSKRTVETEVGVLLEKTIDVAGMKKVDILIKCSAKPITLAFSRNSKTLTKETTT